MKTKAPIVRALVAFVAGAVVGGLVVAGLASKASRQYLVLARLQLHTLEEHEAAQSWARGDLGVALEHLACSTSAMYGSATKAFDPERTVWSLGFPFMAPVLARIMEPNVTPKGEANAQAAARAKLGAVWDGLGRTELAEREYREAARLFGAKDSTNMRELGRELLDQGRARPAPGP